VPTFVSWLLHLLTTLKPPRAQFVINTRSPTLKIANMQTSRTHLLTVYAWKQSCLVRGKVNLILCQCWPLRLGFSTSLRHLSHQGPNSSSTPGRRHWRSQTCKHRTHTSWLYTHERSCLVRGGVNLSLCQCRPLRLVFSTSLRHLSHQGPNSSSTPGRRHLRLQTCKHRAHTSWLYTHESRIAWWGKKLIWARVSADLLVELWKAPSLAPLFCIAAVCERFALKNATGQVAHTCWLGRPCERSPYFEPPPATELG
jgi:hypothetical protein